MVQRKGGTMQEEYIEKMVKNLPVLRAAAGLTQVQLSAKLGVSRQTIVAIENGKTPLTWSSYLAIVCVFTQYEETKELLDKVDLFSSEYIKENL